MKLIVGLGNPGTQYAKTRHNAGFFVLDELAARHAPGEPAKSRFKAATLDARLGDEKCLLLKPTTYMNRSGHSVGEAVQFFKLEPAEDLIVVLDDVALPVGAIRVRARGGAGGHNGLKDIDRALGGAGYPRVRVGIGQTPKLLRQEDWVLSRFTAEEQPDVDRSVREAADAVEKMVRDGIAAAMNTFNKRLPADEKPAKSHPVEEKQEAPTEQETLPRRGKDDIHPGWTAGG